MCLIHANLIVIVVRILVCLVITMEQFKLNFPQIYSMLKKMNKNMNICDVVQDIQCIHYIISQFVYNVKSVKSCWSDI